MSRLKPWKGDAPTIEEAAEVLADEAGYLNGERETTTQPQVRPVGTWTGSEGVLTVTRWTVRAAVVEYGYWSNYREREALVSTTLFQVTQGGLAPDGWAQFDVYKVPGALDEAEARRVADVLISGLPVRLAGGEL